MLFNSWEYIVFFLAFFVLYFSLQHKWRVFLILVASYYFYMSWKWEFGFLMLAVSAGNFYSGKKIGSSTSKHTKRIWLVVAILFSMLPVAYYKYANFFFGMFSDISYALGRQTEMPYFNVILPVGISFFTFQALSYTLDVYQKRTEAETSLPKFLAFISFFPQLVAGPIERSTNLLRQIDEKHHFTSQQFVEGAKLFVWGLFKKIVIADRLALYSDSVFNNPEVHSGETLVLATLFFTFQIYCDFSGYSDMAIGSGRILGFRLMQNFNLPYFAHSISNFWKRWHISLSTWFGDYLYKPLGGSRVSVGRWVFNIFVVFVVSGLWHGANWTFIVWGALHGFYYLLEYIGRKLMEKVGLERLMKTNGYMVFKIGITFIMVAFAWIFFRANNIADAVYISEKIFDWSGQLWWGSSSVTTVLSVLLILLLVFVQLLQYRGTFSIYFRPARVHRTIQWGAYIAMLIGIALFGMSSNAFIYFQF